MKKYYLVSFHWVLFVNKNLHRVIKVFGRHIIFGHSLIVKQIYKLRELLPVAFGIQNVNLYFTCIKK